ncbi:MAG: transposase [Kiritimatiellae bacterium]|nr:transposase [Kiritimatiellia bacterium]
MADNILRNDVEVTFKTFLEGVYAGRSKPFREAAFRIGYGIFRGGSTLLSSIVRAVHPDNRDPDRDKEMRERCSEWLSRDVDDPKKRGPRDIGFARPVNAWLRRRYLERVGRDAGVAFDNSDISKLYGGAGMEGMEMGHDGSSKEPHMGHLFAAATLVPDGNLVPKPLYVELQRGKHAPLELLKRAVAEVMEAAQNRPIGIVDREGDAAEFLWWNIERGHRMVVRVQHMDRDVAGTGEGVAEALSREAWRPVRLRRLDGSWQPARVRHRVGHVARTDKPKKAERSEYRAVLMVESRFDDRSLYFYMTLPEEELADAEKLRARAEQAAQLYMNRWQIEISFLRVKQDYGLEKARVRTFARLENLLALCYLCHVFTHFVLPEAERYGRIVKVLKDNFREVCLRANVLLGHVRTVLDMKTVRYITGRPRGRRRRDASPPTYFQTTLRLAF